MGDMLVPLVFFGAIAGLVSLGVGLNVFTKWAKHRLESDGGDNRFAAMEARIAELEERVDFAERALTEVTSQRQLPP